jgi:class 3 adenylate cyclase
MQGMDAGTGASPGGGLREKTDYESVLASTLRHVAKADRRMGLTSLFWVAHSLQVAEAMEAYFREEGEDPRRKYQLHPLLAGIYRRAEQSSRERLSRSEERKLEFRSGLQRNRSIIMSVVGDQFPLTEVDLRGFDPASALVAKNRRFPIGSAAYEEFKKMLEDRLGEGIIAGDGLIMELLGAAAPWVSPQACLEEGRLERYSFQRPVVEGLLRDVEGTLSGLGKNRILKKEKSRLGGWPRLFDAYLDLADCVLRSQIVCALRRSLIFSRRGFDDRETREKFTEGNLYRLSRSGEVMGNVRKATVLFADLRNFLETSEKAISESNLASQLYRIFDPAAMVVSTFGRSIDKYLGDGFMATFGIQSPVQDANMAALRAAVALQHMLAKLREYEKTDFRMGISLHSGRVAVARFLLDGRREETTPIGRHVSIAGRLSSPKDLVVAAPKEEAPSPLEPAVETLKGVPAPSGRVTLDRHGRLQNSGIAVSGDFLEELKGLPGFESFRDQGRSGFLLRDRGTSLVMRFDYVGNAGFKGLAGKISIYGLVADQGKKSDQRA